MGQIVEGWQCLLQTRFALLVYFFSSHGGSRAGYSEDQNLQKEEDGTVQRARLTTVLRRYARPSTIKIIAFVGPAAKSQETIRSRSFTKVDQNEQMIVMTCHY